MKWITTLTLIIISFTASGQQLVYKPLNPNFGGDTFNYQQLLSSANAQNSFTDPKEDKTKSGLASFSENLNRQLLSQLSRMFFSQQLGDGLTPGTYNFGSLYLEIFETNEGLTINILDTSTGEETQIIVPNP